MKTSFRYFGMSAVLAIVLIATASAGVVAPNAVSAAGPSGSDPTICGSGQLYCNGPYNGVTDAWTINFGYTVTDSFVPTSSSTATSADLLLWLFPGDVPSSIDYEVCTAINTGTNACGGTNLGSGTGVATLVTDFGTNTFGYDLAEYSVTFLSGISVTGGTEYWLQIGNAVVPSGDPVYWDENSGPSSAYESAVGTIPSETFAINGATGTPEPSTLALLGGGTLLIGGLLRRRIHKS